MPKSIKKLRVAAKKHKVSPSIVKPSPGISSRSKKTKMIAKLNGFSILDKKNFKQSIPLQKEKKTLLSKLESSLETQKASSNGRDASDNVKPSSVSTTNKFKASTAIRETERMKLVMSNASFRENPLMAAHKHLEEMLALRAKGLNRGKLATQ